MHLPVAHCYRKLELKSEGPSEELSEMSLRFFSPRGPKELFPCQLWPLGPWLHAFLGFSTLRTSRLPRCPHGLTSGSRWGRAEQRWSRSWSWSPCGLEPRGVAGWCKVPPRDVGFTFTYWLNFLWWMCIIEPMRKKSVFIVGENVYCVITSRYHINQKFWSLACSLSLSVSFHPKSVGQKMSTPGTVPVPTTLLEFSIFLCFSIYHIYLCYLFVVLSYSVKKLTIISCSLTKMKWKEKHEAGFWSGREIGLNSKYSTGKWEFTIKEQGRCQWMENYHEETSEMGDSGYIDPTGTLSEDR